VLARERGREREAVDVEVVDDVAVDAGARSERVVAGPRVCGGMTLPPEIIVEEIKKVIGMRSGVLAGRGG